MRKGEETTHQALLNSIIDAIASKKGCEVLSLELGLLPNSFCEYFVICHAESTTQVEAIADNVEVTITQVHGEKPWRKVGFENKLWIVLDYLDVVVHVFQTQARRYYKLEALWADAPCHLYNDQPIGQKAI